VLLLICWKVVRKMYYFPMMKMNDIYGSRKPWDERKLISSQFENRGIIPSFHQEGVSKVVIHLDASLLMTHVL